MTSSAGHSAVPLEGLVGSAAPAEASAPGIEHATLERVDPRTIDPPYDSPGYRSSTLRAPHHGLLRLPSSPAELAGPIFGDLALGELDHDLTRQHAGEPIGERIVVEGQLRDGAGRPIGGQLIELWQANAAGRYAHRVDDHRAPLDPNFTGYGRCLTGPDGHYRFVTIRPGEYPWGNHLNAWRPAHLHFSIFGRAFVDRLVTQMYFPGDPLFAYDPIFNSVNDPVARQAMVARFELALSEPAFALGYRFDIVVGGRRPSVFEGER